MTKEERENARIVAEMKRNDPSNICYRPSDDSRKYSYRREYTFGHGEDTVEERYYYRDEHVRTKYYN